MVTPAPATSELTSKYSKSGEDSPVPTQYRNSSVVVPLPKEPPLGLIVWSVIPVSIFRVGKPTTVTASLKATVITAQSLTLSVPSAVLEETLVTVGPSLSFSVEVLLL